MILLKVVSAKYLENYKLLLSFNNGSNGIVDLKNKIFSDHRNVFKPLQDIEFFSDFTQNRWTIEWKNGVDLAPEFLYGLIEKKPAGRSLKPT